MQVEHGAEAMLRLGARAVGIAGRAFVPRKLKNVFVGAAVDVVAIAIDEAMIKR